MTTLLIALFLVVMATVTTIGIWWNNRAVASGGGDTIPAFGAVDDSPSVANALQWVGDRAPAGRRKENTTARLLTAAGYRAPSAESIFRGLKWVCVAACAFAGSFSAALTGGDSFLGMLALGALGFFVPDRVLKSLAERRRQRLRSSLPAALDLLVLSVEAGQSLDMALLETARGLRSSHEDIATELTLLNGDLRANTSRADAIRLFAERSGEPELKKLAHLLSDTDRFGTSLGPALRNHSRYLRIRIRQNAQESARKVGVKLIFPVFFLIFPSVILVTLGPAVIMISKQMKTYMAL
jgi:tight adherence protein C